MTKKTSTSSSKYGKNGGIGHKIQELSYQKGTCAIGYIAAISTFLKDRGSAEVVTIVAILGLSRIATELIDKGSQGIDDKVLLTGCLVIATMIFIIGLRAMFWPTKKHVKDTNQNQVETNKPEVSNGCSQK